MAHNQKSPTGKTNQESKSENKNKIQGSANSMREGKAKGSPSNEKKEMDTEGSEQNWQSNPEESRIQKDSGRDVSGRSGEKESNPRRNGNSI